MANNDKLWFELGVRDNITKTLESLIGKSNDLAKSMAIIGKQPMVPGIKDAYDNVAKLNEALSKIGASLSHLRSVKMRVADPKDVAEINRMQLALGRMRAHISRFLEDMSKNKTALETKDMAAGFLSTIGYDTAMTQVSNRTKEYTQKQKDAAQATKDSMAANKALVQSYNEVSKASQKSSRILTQLQQQLMNFTSLYGMERILKSVITIGGQFEYQHIALQNILGDLQQANTLFSQLQVLAVESPKTFMELTSYTKQLSAYQIPYDELFDTTKRLADISTGLGVDMSRLILAYGQVRSAAVLRGQELRQFTEAGIPLVQKLAEKFTQLNGRMVTTGEVFELISKRAVPFKMIQEILWDMTNEGGQFYDMQSKLADTLYGKWQKLQDQWHITLGHIAEGSSASGKSLKFILEMVVQIAKAFDSIVPVIGMISAAKLLKGVGSGVAGIYSRQTGNAAIKNWEITKLKEANRLERERIMYGRQLTQAEQSIVANKNKLVSADYYILAAEKQINAQKTHQLYLEGQLDKLHYYKLLKMQGYTKQQIQQILNAKTLSGLEFVQSGGSFVGNALKKAWNFMGGSLGMAATLVGAYFSLKSNADEKANQAKDVAKSAGDAIFKDLKDVNDLYDEFTKNKPQDTEQVTSAIERMSNALKMSGQYSEELQKSVDSTSDMIEKYNLLYKALQDVSAEYVVLKEEADAAFEAALRVGEGGKISRLWNDPMYVDLQQLSRSRMEKKVAKAGLEIYGASLRSELEQYLREIGKWSEESMRDMDWEGLLDNVNKEYFRNRLKNDRKRDWSEEIEALDKYRDALADVAGKKEEVDSQMPLFTAHIHDSLLKDAEAHNLNIKDILNWGDEDIANLNTWINEKIKALNVDRETSEEVKESILSWFPEEVVVKIKAIKDDIKSDLAPWQDNIKKYFESIKLNIPIDAQTSMEKVEKQLQDKREEFQKQMDRSGGVLIKLGLDLSNLPQSFDDIKDQIPFWMRGYAEKNFNDYNEGKTGVATTDEAGKTLGLSTKKKKKDGSQSDPLLKQWKERKQALDEYYKLYKEYSQYMSKEEAIKRINATGLIKGQAMPDNIDDYLAVMEAFKNNIKGKIKGTDRQSFWNSLVADYNKKDFEQNTKEVADAMLKQLEKSLKEEGKKWDLYKKILDATGSKEKASNIAFGGGVRFDNFAQELRDKINKELEKYPNAKNEGIDKLLGLNAEELENLGVYGKSELIPMLKELADVEQQLKAEDVELFLEALKNAKSLDTELDQIKVKYDRIRESINNNANLSQEEKNTLTSNADRNEAEARANKVWEYFKKDEELGRVFGNLNRMSTKTLENMKRKLEEVAPSIDESVEATKALYEAIEKINNALGDRNPFKTISDALSKHKGIKDYLKQYKGSKDDDIVFISDETAKKYGLKAGRQTFGDLKRQAKDTDYAATADFLSGLQGVSTKFDAITKAAQPLIDIFNQLGMTELGQAISGAQNAIGGGVNGALAFAALGLNPATGLAIGAALSVASSMLGSVLSGHDESIKEEIEASKALKQEMENLSKNIEKILERSLGGIYTYNTAENRSKFEQAVGGFLSERISNSSWLGNKRKYEDVTTQAERNAIDKALQSGEYFDQQYALLVMQRKQVEDMLEGEKELKDPDDGNIAAYKQQIEELDDQIKNFAIDMAKALYDIDIKSWAQEFSDALVTAWENGEDAAEAYSKSVKSVMKNLAKTILQKKVMEKAFENAGIDNIIANIMTSKSGKLDYEDVARLSNAVMGAGQQTADIYNAVLDELYKRGVIDKEGSNGGLSSTIKGVTESTADLLASYINAIRLDVSVNRGMIAQYYPQFLNGISQGNIIANAQLTQLQMIASSTKKNAEIARDIYDILHASQNGTKALKTKS